MPLFGKIVVIKRDGTDGTHFPLTVNSCTFGRTKECDIRIQLPHVSKEHCKIEVNENKEAILINLSAVNPTHLNGSECQQPMYLKHGDVLTIIDRSFRFEYPPAPLSRKKIARSEEKETLQVLHVQQVEQEELHPQNSECKSLQTSDEKPEREGQKTNGNHEQRTHEDTTSQNGTNESTCQLRRSGRKNMSPFGTLYELMKHEVDTKLTEESFSNKLSLQQKVDYSPRKDSIDIVESQTPHRISACDQTIQTEETETVALEDFEQPTGTEKQGRNVIVFDPMFVKENSSRRSPRVLQTCAANERQDSEETNLLHFQNLKENEDSEVIRSTNYDANRQSSECSFTSCSIVALEYSEKASCYERSLSPSTKTVNVEVKTNLNTSSSVGSVLPRPKAEGESFETCSSPCGMLQTKLDPLLGLKSTAEISTEIEEGIIPVTTGEEESDVLLENKYLKTNRNNELLDTEQPFDAQIREGTKTESDLLQDGHFETVVCSVHHSKSPRRSTRQRRNFSNAGSMITEDSLVTVRDVSPFKGVPEENKVKYWPQENDGNIEERPTTESLENNLGMKNIAGSSYLPARYHGSHVQMPAEDVVQEMNVSNQCSIKKEPATQKSPRKHKGGEADLSIQPLGKRKRVSFGGQLSPELFDKRLPPNSPLKRGAIPARFSLPFGNSPRAVLKKSSGFKQCITKGFSGKEQKNALSRKQSPAASPPARRSPAASPPARRSPAASPPARRSPAASPPARRTPAASPPARRSPAASPPARRSPAASPSNLPQIRGRFSVSRVEVPSLSSVDQNVLEVEMDVNKEVKTPEPSQQESKTVQSIRRSNKFAPKRTSLHRRSGAMDAIRAKRQSGASEANLIVSRSWAEVVKQGVAKSQQRTTSRCGLKRRAAKKIPAKAPKGNVSLKTPTRKVKGYFTTGHANSPAPVIVGKAHTSIVKITAQAPKVMFNRTLKQQQDTNESFTGMAEMFHTPLNWQQGSSLSTVQKPNVSTPEEASEIHTPEESGEMTVSPLNLSIQQMYDNQDIESPILRKLSQISTVDQHEQKVPRGGNSVLDEIVGGNSSLITNEIVGMEEIPKDLIEKSDCFEAHSGTKRLTRTPKQKPEPVKMLSGVKELFRTPKEDPEPTEMLSGVKMLLRTPKEDPEQVEVLSGAKRLLRTPKQKPEPVEALSGVKRLLRTPKQKPEPVEALSGVKRLLRTPKQKPEPVEALSGVKRLLRTPKQKPEPVEALSGVKRLLRTPKQKPEPVEALSGVKRLLRTPKQKPEPVEALSGVKRLLRTPKQKSEPVEDDICSKVLNSPAGLFDLNHMTKEPKEKIELVEDMEEIQSQLGTPKQNIEPVEDMIGISRILKTPMQTFMPVEDYLGLQNPMAEPKQNSVSAEIDYTGVQELLGPVDEYLVKLSEPVNEPHENSSSEFGCKGDIPEREESHQETGLEDSFERKSPNAVLRRPDDGHDELQDYLGHASCSSLNDVTGADVESIETVQFIPEKNKSDGMDFQSGTIIEESSARQGDLVETNAEILESSASAKKPRKGKVGEYSSAEEHDTAKTQRQARNSSGAKLANCKQTNENFDQNTPETSPAKESENNPPALETETPERLREKSRKHSIETSRNMDLDNIRHTQELLGLSKEMSVKTQLSVNRRVAAKLNRQAEESLHLEENAAHQEYANQFVSKTSLISRNQKNKDEPKSEFTKTNSQEKIQSPNLQTSKRNSGNQLLKEHKRRKPVSVETDMEAVDGEKHISTEMCKLESLENHQTEVKEGAVKRRKEGKVHFLLEKNISEPPEKCVFGGKGGTQQYSTFFESINPPMQENSQRNKRKAASIVSPTLCVSLSSEKHALAEISKDREENFILANKDQASFAQGECLQVINCDENANEIQMVPLENTQIYLEHSAPKRQKVAEAAKKSTPRRGRSRAASHQPPTENGSEVTPETEKQPTNVENAISSKDNQPKRGRRRKVAPVSQTLTVPKEDRSRQEVSHEPATDHDNNEYPDVEKQDMVAENASPANENQHKRGRRRKVAPVSQTLTVPKEDRSRQEDSHEPATDHDNNEHPDVEKQDMVAENASPANENQPKRGRRRKVAPVSQTLTVPKEDRSRQEVSHESATDNDNNEHPDVENQDMVVENASLANENQPKSGRRRKVAPVSQTLTVPKEDRSRQEDSHESATDNDNNEHPVVENQDMVVEDASVADENQPKRGRRRKVAPLSQTLTVPKEDKSRQEVSHELATDHDNNEYPDVERQDMVAENASPANENQNKRGRRRKVAPVSQTLTVPKEDRSRQEDSHESATDHDNNEHPVVENQDMVVEDASVADENQPKRGRRRKVAPLSQTLTVPKEDRSRQEVSHELATDHDNNEYPDVEKQDMVAENASPANENQNKRGRRRKVAPVSQTLTVPKEDRSRQEDSHEPATDHDNNEHPDVENQDMVAENASLANENQPKRGRRRKVAPVSQTLTVTKEDRSRQEVSHEPATDHDNNEHPVVENQDMVVEDASLADKNQPKRGRRRKVAAVSQSLTVPKEDPSTGSSGFAQEKCLQDTQNEENSYETQKVTLDNIESSVEHILPKRQKVAKRNLPQRGRNKQIVSHEPPTESDNKDTPDVENEDAAVKNAITVKENQPKKGRGRKVATVPQVLESDSFPLSSKDKSAAEEQDETLEMATTANNPFLKGRSRKTLVTISVPSSKKSRVVDNADQEEMTSVLKDVTKENRSKRGRTKLPAYEASTETNSQQRATGSKLSPVKGKNQSKRSQGKNIVLAFQTPSSPALKISITLPLSPSDKMETASENQNLFIENNDTGKENLAINGRRNTSARRKCKLPEEKEEFQEKQNMNEEQIGVSNGKQSRRATRKGGAPKTTFFKETCGLSESSDGIPKDQQVIMTNTMEDASQCRRRRILKGKNLPKHSDQKNDLEIALSQGKENTSIRGRRKQVRTEPETHGTISGTKKCTFAENTAAAPEAENTGNALRRGRRKKMKEEHTSATAEHAVETQTEMKARRRRTKQVL